MRRKSLARWGWAILVATAAVVTSGGALAQADVDGVLKANRVATGAPPPGTVAIRRTYIFVGSGLTGRYVTTDDPKDGRYIDALAVGPVAQVNGFDGSHAWLKAPSGAVTAQDGGEERQLAVSEAYRTANLWWRDDYGGAQVTAHGAKREAGRLLDVLTVSPDGGKPFEAWFDADTHLLDRTVTVRGAQTVTVSFSGYRRVEGVMLAGTITIDADAGPKAVQTLTLSDVAYLHSLDAAAFATPVSTLAGAAIAGGARQVSLPVRLVDNRPYVGVSVDGNGPFLFIVDTGATNTITAPLARTLGLAVQGHSEDHSGAGEGAMETGFAKVAELDIAGARISNQVAEVDPDSLANVEGLGDKGILGFETFSRFVVRIDYGRGVLTLIDPKVFDPKDAGTPIPFDFEGNVVEIAGKFEGLPVRLIVDTGSRAEIVLNKPFVEQNHLRDKHPHGIDTVVGWGTGGPARGYATRGAALDVGPIPVGSVVALLSTQDKGAFAGSDFDGEIGGGVLKRFVVTFDYAHQRMYLKPTDVPPADVDTFDRAGMWFNRSDAGFVVVDVTRGGSAAKAGIEPGDEIVTVNGAPAKNLQVYDLRRRLRNERPGTVVTFKVRRNGRLRTSSVTLRNLI